MKKLFFFTIILSVVLSCNNETVKENDFTVSGVIENGVGEKIVLIKLGSNSTPIDTVELGQDGAFSFSDDAVSNSPEFYVLTMVGSNSFIKLVIDSSDHIKVNSDTSNFAENYTVDGSKDSKLVKELDMRLRETLLSIDSLEIIYQEAMSGANHNRMTSDSVKTVLNKRFTKIYDKQHSYSIKFIETNHNSLASIVALSQEIAKDMRVIDIGKEREHFDKVDKTLFELYPNSESVIALHNFLEGKTTPPKTGKVNIGEEAPDISLPTPEGKELKLSSLRGNYVLLDFWASWCPPCRRENPNLVSTYNKYKSKGFTIFQVSLDKIDEEWKKGIKKDKLDNWHHVSDLLFWDSAPAARYGVRSIPASFLIDPSGKIIEINLKSESLGLKLSEIYGF